MKTRLSIYSAVIAVFALTAALQLAGQDTQDHNKNHHYKVIDLGTFGGTSSFAAGINKKGWVTGAAFLRHDKAQHAFLWKNGRKIDLGTLGGPNSAPLGGGLNERDQVVGTAETSIPDPNGEDFCGFGTNLICLPSFWQRGTVTALPTLGGNNGYAQDINNRGAVGGSAENSTQNTACSSGGLETKPVIWQDGNVQELPTISGDPDGVVDSINDHGQAVGGSGICSPLSTHTAHALLWENGSVTDLGNLGGTDFEEALHVNEHGQVVGVSTLPGNIYNRAFLWQSGAMTNLGAIPGLTYYSQANGINEKGQVTGFSCDVNFDCVAFLWEKGAMTDLNALTPAGSPLVYIGADVNDRGEISGFGELANGDSHAVVLIPCDENHPDIEGCDYSVVDERAAVKTSFSTTGRNPVQPVLRPPLGTRVYAPSPGGSDTMAAATAEPFGLLEPRPFTNQIGQRCVKAGGLCWGRFRCCPGLRCMAIGNRNKCWY